uniref:Protein argonaute N-terminal domain-containing protein n=1 Tax=Arundo donax TaxID=35708 RepID=A0A0A8XZL0_ARUDO
MNFAYDGEKSLFTIGTLQHVKDVFTVVVKDASSAKTVTSRSPGGNGSPGGSDMKRMKRPMQAKTLKVELSLAGKVPMGAITKVLRGQESDHYQMCLRR